MNICTELVQCRSDAWAKQPPQYQRPRIDMIFKQYERGDSLKKKNLYFGMLSLLGLSFQKAERACSMQANGHNACVLDFVPCFSRVDCCLQQVKRLSLRRELVEHAIGFQEWNCSSGISLDGKEDTLSSLFFFFYPFFKNRAHILILT